MVKPFGIEREREREREARGMRRKRERAEPWFVPLPLSPRTRMSNAFRYGRVVMLVICAVSVPIAKPNFQPT